MATSPEYDQISISLFSIRKYFKPLALSFDNGWKAKPRFKIPPESYLIISSKGSACFGILNGTKIYRCKIKWSFMTTKTNKLDGSLRIAIGLQSSKPHQSEASFSHARDNTSLSNIKRAILEAHDIDEEEKVQRTVVSEMELIFNRLDDLEVDSRLTVPKRKVDVFAEELKNLIEERVALFHQVGEWYFEALDIDKEEEKVHTVVMYLTDTAASWWRCRYTDGCDVKTWEKFKCELQRQFYPDSVDDKPLTAEAEGSICKYVKEYSALMLEIPKMFERQQLCFFVDGLQQWVPTLLRQRKPHDLTFVMAIVKRLEDFKQGERPRSPRHERAKDGGDGKSKSGSPKATDDEQIGDEGRCCHHKEEEKHEGSGKQGDSGGCFYCAGPYYRRDCPHKGKMIAFLEKHKGNKGDSFSSDGEACMGALQMVNAFVQKSKEETTKRKKSKTR
ncbi:hypothetical protein RJ639_024774 [Escallonia herrerae]|uniref:Retrotransposon gag domain-containing protein n=1 Tax=Escallonia herrerae TaxID=1293975 RepID=A0AA88S681_9ASTE|nr:hypothetical protein RJ639_024774 [Escallonia herrerae]